MQQDRRRIYADHAATSHPKPSCVAEAMVACLEEVGASPGRGAYDEARRAGEILEECRARAHRLVHGEGGPERVVFTLNCSDALHLAIKGVLLRAARGGRRPVAITTWMDHNSVLRPLRALEDAGVIGVVRVRCDPSSGLVDVEDVRRAIRAHADAALIAVAHASNVSGTLQPIGAIGRVAREAGVPLLVDAAQTLGHVPVDVRAMGIDLLAFPGHKGLLGPSGTGGLYLAPGMERVVGTVREGGTGSRSEADVQPEILPDKYEAGSHNIVGLAGLAASLGWILDRGVDALHAHERAVSGAFLAAFREGAERAGARLIGPQDLEDRVGVFSVLCATLSAEEASGRLEREFGVLTRSGLHCAPLAHRTLGTSARGGTTRLSFGALTSAEDAVFAARALLTVAGCVHTEMRDGARFGARLHV